MSIYRLDSDRGVLFTGSLAQVKKEFELRKRFLEEPGEWVGVIDQNREFYDIECIPMPCRKEKEVYPAKQRENILKQFLTRLILTFK